MPRLRAISAGDSVELIDNSGRVRAVIELDEHYPAFVIFDVKGVERISLGLNEDGTAAATLKDSRRRNRIIVEMTEDDSALMRFLDEYQRPVGTQLWRSQIAIEDLCRGRDKDNG